jgi:hypothetical protein
VRQTTTRWVGILFCGLLVGACANPVGAGWTLGPTDLAGAIAASGTPPPSASALPSCTAASPSAAASPTPDGREPLPYPDAQSHGVATIAFSRPILSSIDLPIACEWTSPTVAAYFYATPATVSLGGEAVSIYFEPRSPGYGFRLGHEGAASYGPGPNSGKVGLERVGEGWSSGTLWFDIGVETQLGGPLLVPIEDWLRPLGDDPSLRWLQGTVTWSCEPAPPTVLEPEPEPSIEPGPTFPPLPRLTLVTDGVVRDAVSGCGASIDIDGYTAADSCGPSFQALGVDYIVRVREGDDLRFVLPVGWRFERWSLGWVNQIEAERWHGEQPDGFELVRTGEATNGRALETDAPPAGDWSVRLDWTGARDTDSFSAPDYFRVLVE